MADAKKAQVVASGGAGSAPDPAAGEHAISLVHRHVFGLKANVKGNVHFTEETQVLYPAGHNTILYMMESKTQSKIFAGTEGSEGITCLAVSPSRKFLAVCEKLNDRAVCSIFDINSGKRRRGTLTYPDCDAREFVCAAFSADNKYLITQGGPPDWTLVLWSWDKARPQGAVKVSNLTGSVIYECSFNPQDSNLVCVVGDGVFKFFRLQEGSFKNIPNALSKLRESSNQNYVCHAWLHEDKLLVCSEAGDALLFDNGGEFKMVLPCSPGEFRSMQCVTAYSKGFVAGGEGGIIRIFEKSDDVKEMFKRVKDLKIDGSGPGAGAVTSLAVSPTEELLAMTTSNSQLLQVSLSPSDLLKAEESTFVDVLTSFHCGPILGLDVCTRKPLVVTCGNDKSVRVWNYIDKTQELCKFFGEEACSVAFHPSGFHLIVGFSDKLRLMNLLMEELRTYKELPIKSCKECRFSHGGQFFAAVNSNTISVYKTYTCESVCNLRGHQAKVRSVCWTDDDTRLVSAGTDGAAYEYDILKEGRRVSDWAEKGTNFSCVIAHTDIAKQTNTMYIVGNDKMIKEVSPGAERGVQRGEISNYYESNMMLGQLALANSGKTLFAGVTEPDFPGSIRCYDFPLNSTYKEEQAHSAPVSRIRVTYDDQFLFSAGDDGCLCIWDVVAKKGPGKARQDALTFADEILVTRQFLDDKQAALLDLERQVEELTNRIEFQLRHRDGYHKEKMAELQEKYSEEIESERRKYEVLREQKTETEMISEEKIRNLDETHSRQTQELEQSFQQKMLVEVQRYQRLAQDLEREKQEWDAQHAQLLQEHERTADQMRHDNERRQGEIRDTRERIVNDKELAFKHHQETLAQLEQDADREIEELKEMYEDRLSMEKDEKVRLRGQAGIHKKHFDDLKRQMEMKHNDVKKEDERNRKMKERIDTLLKEKDSNEKEIKERDKTIADKEQRIRDLRNQNQELEKFRFVLDYKIKELKAQIDPKDYDIDSMKKQIQAMDGELDNYKRLNKKLALEISKLQMKQRALQDEILLQKRRLKDDLALIKRFKLDLSECMQCVSEPKSLKEAVANLYRKYVQGSPKKLDLDTDMQKEYNRQRDYLEKSVDSLKRKLDKDSKVHRIDNMRIMQENVSLIREINDLRREINALKHERTAQEVQAMSQSGRDERSADRELAMQREEIQALSRHLQELETNAPRLTTPGTRLPPLDASGAAPADAGLSDQDAFPEAPGDGGDADAADADAADGPGTGADMTQIGPRDAPDEEAEPAEEAAEAPADGETAVEAVEDAGAELNAEADTEALPSEQPAEGEAGGEAEGGAGGEAGEEGGVEVAEPAAEAAEVLAEAPPADEAVAEEAAPDEPAAEEEAVAEAPPADEAAAEVPPEGGGEEA